PCRARSLLPGFWLYALYQGLAGGAREAGSSWTKTRFASPGRPVHGASAQQMQVHVKHSLTRSRVRVHHRSIALLADTFGAGDSRRHQRQAAEHLGVVRLVERRDVRTWNHEHVYRRLRIDVAKGNRVLVFGNE